MTFVFGFLFYPNWFPDLFAYGCNPGYCLPTVSTSKRSTALCRFDEHMSSVEHVIPDFRVFLLIFGFIDESQSDAALVFRSAQ